jgi:hypothetical protein
MTMHKAPELTIAFVILAARSVPCPASNSVNHTYLTPIIKSAILFFGQICEQGYTRLTRTDSSYVGYMWWSQCGDKRGIRNVTGSGGLFASKHGLRAGGLPSLMPTRSCGECFTHQRFVSSS